MGYVDKELMKILALCGAIVLLYLLALGACFYGAGKLDDGGAKSPSEWNGPPLIR